MGVVGIEWGMIKWRGENKLLVYTWIGMENTKGLQGRKYYPSSNPTQRAESINICNQMFLEIFDEKH